MNYKRLEHVVDWLAFWKCRFYDLRHLEREQKKGGEEMSKPKDDWFKSAVCAVRTYPARKKEYEELHSQSICANLSGMPKGNSVSRTVEIIALREMAPMKQKEYEAVTQAIEVTKMLPNGNKRIELITRKYWKGKELAIKDVIPHIHVAQATGDRWHSAFIRLVGEFMGYVN